MLYLIIFGGLYITLVFTDFVPLLREKEKVFVVLFSCLYRYAGRKYSVWSEFSHDQYYEDS